MSQMYRRARLAMVGVVVACATLVGQSTTSPDDRLVEALVWGPPGRGARPLDVRDYPQPLCARLQSYLGRDKRFRSRLPVPKPMGPDMKMVYYAHTAYERKLVDVATDAGGAEAAWKYVQALKPCYEWEGYSDCPVREAEFGARYLRDHPRSVFAAYRPLLIAHRWICAAQACDDEKKPEAAARARNDYSKALDGARHSSDPLVRYGVDPLARGNRAGRRTRADPYAHLRH